MHNTQTEKYSTQTCPFKQERHFPSRLLQFEKKHFAILQLSFANLFTNNIRLSKIEKLEATQIHSFLIR